MSYKETELSTYSEKKEISKLKKEGDSGILQFKVSSKSNIHKVSSAIYKTFLEEKSFEIIAIGAGACNQAVKSIAESKGKLAKSGKEVLFNISFRDIPAENKPNGVISALVFNIVEVGNGN